MTNQPKSEAEEGAAPRRIQRSRAKGWRKPDGSIIVTRPTKWGNPYDIGDHDRCWRATVVEMFRGWLRDPDQAPLVAEIKAKLRGHDLVCWCPLGGPCHADVLLELANDLPPTNQKGEGA